MKFESKTFNSKKILETRYQKIRIKPIDSKVQNKFKISVESCETDNLNKPPNKLDKKNFTRNKNDKAFKSAMGNHDEITNSFFPHVLFPNFQDFRSLP